LQLFCLGSLAIKEESTPLADAKRSFAILREHENAEPRPFVIHKAPPARPDAVTRGMSGWYWGWSSLRRLGPAAITMGLDEVLKFANRGLSSGTSKTKTSLRDNA